MSPRALSVALGDDGVHVVVQDLTRHAAERGKRPFGAIQQPLQPLAINQLHVRRRAQPSVVIRAAPNADEIGLQLPSRFGLKANQWFVRRRRLELHHMQLQRGQAAAVTERRQLAHSSSNVIADAGADYLADLLLDWPRQ
jgi:hypothetical protein